MREDQKKFLKSWNTDQISFSEYFEETEDLSHLMDWIQQEVDSLQDNVQVYRKLMLLCHAISMQSIIGSPRNIPNDLEAFREFMCSNDLLSSVNVPFERWNDTLEVIVKIAKDGIRKRFKSLGAYHTHPDDDLLRERFRKAIWDLQIEYPTLQDPMGR